MCLLTDLEMEVAHSMLAVLRDNLQILIESINNESSVPHADKEVILEKCPGMLNIVEKAAEDIGHYDIRRVGGKKLIAELDSFYGMLSAFDMMKNSNKNQGILKMFSKTIQTVEGCLNQPWNSDLLPATENDNSTQMDVIVNLPNEPVPEAELDTPKGKKVQIFEKFSPLFKQAVIPDCIVCGVKFTHPKSINPHYKKFHPDPNVTVPKIREILGTCKLADKQNPSQRCGKRFAQHQIKRHLKV